MHVAPPSWKHEARCVPQQRPPRTRPLSVSPVVDRLRLGLHTRGTEERVRLEVHMVFTRAMQPLPQQMVQVLVLPSPFSLVSASLCHR